MEKFGGGGRLEVGLALVRVVSARHLPRPFVYVAGSYLYRWIIPILDQQCTTKAHRAVISAIVRLSCLANIAEKSCLERRVQTWTAAKSDARVRGGGHDVTSAHLSQLIVTYSPLSPSRRCSPPVVRRAYINERRRRCPANCPNCVNSVAKDARRRTANDTGGTGLRRTTHVTCRRPPRVLWDHPRRRLLPDDYWLWLTVARSLARVDEINSDR